jgi:hypothetical protein
VSGLCLCVSLFVCLCVPTEKYDQFIIFLLIYFIINYLLFIQFLVLFRLSFLDSFTTPSTCSLFRLGESFTMNCMLLTFRHVEFISTQEGGKQFACIMPKRQQ